ncbi:MAG: VWA domain-containing protein [Planctomycetota bacterium]|nr:VWA domain-containing protein [Planctomycetota bacterium]
MGIPVSFFQPIWFLLAIPVLAILLARPATSRTLGCLRVLIFSALLMAIADPRIEDQSRQGSLVVLLDRSQSMPGSSDEIQKRILERLEETRNNLQKLRIISFGERAAVESTSDLNQVVGSQSSRLDNALELALLSVPAEERARILCVSDGNYTHRSPDRLAAMAATRNIAIDYRFLSRPKAGDLGIIRLQSPVRVEPNEIFTVTAWIQSPLPQEVRYELTRSGKVVTAGKKQVPSGTSSIQFRDLLPEPLTGQYLLSIQPSDPAASASDPNSENNRARFLVQSNGKKPVLVITEKENSPLARLLINGGVPTRATHPNSIQLDLATLSGFSGVIIENVPHQEIGTNGIAALTDWVVTSGGGVLLTGGQRSFGQGGYYQSRLEEILPVSMELRKEFRKASLAILLVLDRSGSMAMPVAGGKTKMDLANEASANVVDLLTPMDEVGVVAVDSTPHVIVNLQKLSYKERVRSRVRRIQSMGGGIFVYEGLSKAMQMLKQSQAAARHIILFSDAADSERPGAYGKLLSDGEKLGITCSVIALGRKSDPDANLLIDIARRGNGRSFFTTDARQLPELFAQDTFTVARSFIDTRTPVKTTPLLESILRGWNQQKTAGMNSVGGYNLTYLRDQANLGIVTEDENRAPLLASWHVGTGRAACYTGQIDGKWTGQIAQWKDYPGFLNSVTRWISSDQQTEGQGFVITQKMERGQHIITMHLDLDPSRHAIKTAPVIQTLSSSPSGLSEKSAPVKMQWVTPHRLEYRHDLEGAKTYLSSIVLPVSAGEENPRAVALAPVTTPYPAEFQPISDSLLEDQRGDGKSSLESLATRTGGQERVDMKGIWDTIPETIGFESISTWFYMATILFLLAEVLERRTGYVGQALKYSNWKRRTRETVVTGNLEAEDGAAGTPAPNQKQKREFGWWGTRTRPGRKVSTAEPGSRPLASTSTENPREAADRSDQKVTTGETGQTANPVPDQTGGSVTDALAAARARSQRRMKKRD